MLKLGIRMDNELLYCGIENRTSCSYSSLYLSIFLSFKAKFVLQFSPELCKLESSNVVYICRICRMSDCVVGFQGHGSYYMLTFKICVGVFSGIFQARMLKLLDSELLYCGIENWTPCLSSFLSFCI